MMPKKSKNINISEESKGLEAIKQLLVLLAIKSKISPKYIGKAIGVNNTRISQMYPVKEIQGDEKSKKKKY